MQINRLFEIIYVLLEKEKVTAKELSKRFEVSQRTIYRDIETLSAAGIPIYMIKGKGGGISLLPNFILNKAVLTEQEKADILSSLKAVNAVNFTRSDTTLEKMDSMLGNSNSDWIEVDFSSWGNYEKEAENFKILKGAVIEKRKIKFDYASGRSEKTKREVLPLKLVFKSTAWYLYGFCELRKDFRFFKLRRIENLELEEDTFQMEIPSIIPNIGKNYSTIQMIKAKLEISYKMAFRVYDEFTEYKELENGNFLCEILMPDIESICVYASSFGEFCRIIEPVQAKERLKGMVERMLKRCF